MGCGASTMSDATLAEVLRPRVHPGAVEDVLLAFEATGATRAAAIDALEERRVLPGNKYDLCNALHLDPQKADRLTRAQVVFDAKSRPPTPRVTR